MGEVEAHKGMLTGQVTTLRSKWTNATNDNMRLQAELGTLRKTLQVLHRFPPILAGMMDNIHMIERPYSRPPWHGKSCLNQHGLRRGA